MAKVIIRSMKVGDLPAFLSEGLEAGPDEQARIIVDAERESAVEALINLARRIGRLASDRGLTESRLQALL